MPSSVIRDIAYDSERTELKVSFVSGKVYIYALVPAAVAAALANADAKGVYFNAHVRDRYPFRKARAPAPGEADRASLHAALKASQGG
jgi:hypothetical protein